MNLRYGSFFKVPRKIAKYCLHRIYPLVVNFLPLPKVLSITDTLQLLATDETKSIVRFGDGEFLYLIDKLNLPFQTYDASLATHFQEILKSNEPDILVGLPSGYHSTDLLSAKGKRFWRAQISWIYPRLRKYLNVDKVYANASITRLFVEYENKTHSKQWFTTFMSIWEGKNVVLIEGEKSRIGVGNNLFKKAKSVQRILGPKHHAYAKYDELLAAAHKLPKNRLILIALGPCAKPLVFNLAKAGYRVIDIGNLDIEYEWFLQGAKKKVKIQGKYTSEAKGGREVEDVFDQSYFDEIILTITH